MLIRIFLFTDCEIMVTGTCLNAVMFQDKHRYIGCYFTFYTNVKLRPAWRNPSNLREET